MKFVYAENTYVLEFERERKLVTIARSGKKNSVQSKYPYTTATLYVLSADSKTRSVVAHDTVGCCPNDPYSNAAGRLYALRGLTAILKNRGFDRDFREALWKTYVNRDKKPVVEGEVVKETVH